MGENKEEEELVLASFVKPPFVTFPNTRPQQATQTKLRLFNPSDSSLSATLEKFPHKTAKGKGTFEVLSGIDKENKIVVPPDGAVDVAIQWTPEGPGNIREMVQWKVEGDGNMFRTIAYLVGASVAAKTAPLIRKRKGGGMKPKVLGQKQAQADGTTFTWISQAQATTHQPPASSNEGRKGGGDQLHSSHFQSGASSAAKKMLNDGINDTELTQSPRRDTFVVSKKEKMTETESKQVTKTTRQILSPRKVNSGGPEYGVEEGEVTVVVKENTVLHVHTTTVEQEIHIQEGYDSYVSEMVGVGGPSGWKTFTLDGGREAEGEERGGDEGPSTPPPATTLFSSPAVPIHRPKVRFRDGGQEPPTMHDEVDRAGPPLQILNSTVDPLNGEPAVNILPEDLGSAIFSRKRHLHVINTPSTNTPGPGRLRRSLSMDLSPRRTPKSAMSGTKEDPTVRCLSREMEDPIEADVLPSHPTSLRKIQSLRSLHTAPSAIFAKNSEEEDDSENRLKVAFEAWLNAALKTDKDQGELPLGALSQEAARRLVLGVEKGGKAQGAQSVSPVPSTERLSLRHYAEEKQLQQLRRQARTLHDSAQLTCFRAKLKEAVKKNKIRIHPDKSISSDVGLKAEVIRMLSSVNPLWLRVGLEVVFEEVIPMHPSLRPRVVLLHFAATRLLNDPQIQDRYAHVTIKTFLNKRGAEELGQHFLEKFVYLMVFLDSAKQARLMLHDPCLFIKQKSEFKSIKVVLDAVTKIMTSADSNLMKTVLRCGYDTRKIHIQSALDEYNFFVRNLSVDLRDGIILTRVVEILRMRKLGEDKKLLCPTTSRVQKITNMESVLFDALEKDGMDLSGLEPRKIVDGHKELSFSLLWRMVLHYGLKIGLEHDELRKEMQRLKTLVEERGIENMDVTLSHSFSSKEEEEGEGVRLLLEWTKHVCFLQGVTVRNFETNFTNGKALLALLKFYQPEIVPRLSQTKLVGDKHHDLRLFLNSVEELGGVAALIHPDSLPLSSWNIDIDRRIIIMYVATLCNRLLSLRGTTEAARTLQTHWRRYSLRQTFRKIVSMAVTKRETEKRAAAKIQSFWRTTGKWRIFMRKLGELVILNQKARLIQKIWRGYRERRQYKALWHSCGRMQAIRRMMPIRRQFVLKKTSAISIQSWWKMVWTKAAYTEIRDATITIQSGFRGWMARRESHKRMAAIIKCQALFRGRAVRKKLERERRAATLIQAQWRGRVVRRRTQQLKAVAILVQGRYRALRLMKRERREFQTLKAAAIHIQAVTRGFLVRRQLERERRAAVVVQSEWRMIVERRRWREKRRAAVVIQRWRRAEVVRRVEEEERRRRAATLIFTRIRRHLFVKHIQATIERKNRERMAVKIQSVWRRYRLEKEYQEKRRNASLLQRWYRQILAERKRRNQAAITLQRSVRALLFRKRIERAYMERRKRRNEAATVLQKVWRGNRTRHLSTEIVQECRRKVAVATERAATEGIQTIGEREALGLRTLTKYRALMTYRDLRQLRDAISHIEVSTRWSHEGCKRIVREGTVSKLYGILNEANQSPHYFEVVDLVIRVLTNIAKVESVSESLVGVEGWLESVVHQIGVARQRDLRVFLNGCTLLIALTTLHLHIITQELERCSGYNSKLKDIQEVLQKKQERDIEDRFFKVAKAEGTFKAVRARREWVAEEGRIQTVIDGTYILPLWLCVRQRPMTPLQAITSLNKRLGLSS